MELGADLMNDVESGANMSSYEWIRGIFDEPENELGAFLSGIDMELGVDLMNDVELGATMWHYECIRGVFFWNWYEIRGRFDERGWIRGKMVKLRVN